MIYVYYVVFYWVLFRVNIFYLIKNNKIREIVNYGVELKF